MAWETMAGAGAGFLAVGLWRLLSAISSDTGKRRSILQCDLQPILVAAFACFHLFASVFSSRKDWQSGYPVASALSLESSGTALMFLVYSITVILKERTRILPLPREIVSLLAVAGFGLEFFLFYLKEDDGMGVQSQYHRLLLVPIGVCLLTTALRIAYPLSELLLLIQNMGLILQGTWFFQMASSLFTKSGIAQGCWLDESGEGDYAVHCKGMDLMRGKAIATLQFNLHLAMLLVTVLPIYGFLTSKTSSKSVKYQQLGNGEAQHQQQGNLQMSEIGTQNGLHSQTYVLEEEEED